MKAKEFLDKQLGFEQSVLEETPDTIKYNKVIQLMQDYSDYMMVKQQLFLSNYLLNFYKNEKVGEQMTRELSKVKM